MSDLENPSHGFSLTSPITGHQQVDLPSPNWRVTTKYLPYFSNMAKLIRKGMPSSSSTVVPKRSIRGATTNSLSQIRSWVSVSNSLGSTQILLFCLRTLVQNIVLESSGAELQVFLVQSSSSPWTPQCGGQAHAMRWSVVGKFMIYPACVWGNPKIKPFFTGTFSGTFGYCLWGGGCSSNKKQARKTLIPFTQVHWMVMYREVDKWLFHNPELLSCHADCNLLTGNEDYYLID